MPITDMQITAMPIYWYYWRRSDASESMTATARECRTPHGRPLSRRITWARHGRRMTRLRQQMRRHTIHRSSRHAHPLRRRRTHQRALVPAHVHAFTHPHLCVCTRLTACFRHDVSHISAYRAMHMPRHLSTRRRMHLSKHMSVHMSIRSSTPTIDPTEEPTYEPTLEPTSTVRMCLQQRPSLHANLQTHACTLVSPVEAMTLGPLAVATPIFSLPHKLLLQVVAADCCCLRNITTLSTLLLADSR